jgi:hypothetical protein
MKAVGYHLGNRGLFHKEGYLMRTEFDQYVIEHQLDTRHIFQVAGVRYAVVYYALRGGPILPESAEKD